MSIDILLPSIIAPLFCSIAFKASSEFLKVIKAYPRHSLVKGSLITLTDSISPRLENKGSTSDSVVFFDKLEM